MPNECGCRWDSETGYFEACSEAHEQEYVAYLEELAKRRLPADQSADPRDGEA